MKIKDADLECIQEEIDSSLDRLFYLMEKKKTDQGDLTIKISVDLIPSIEEIIDEDGTVTENTIKVPFFEYSITQNLKITNKYKGKVEPMKKLIYDESTGEYRLAAIEDNQTEMEI